MKKIISFIVFFLCFIKLCAQIDNRGVVIANNKKDTNLVKGNTYAIIVGISNYKNVPHLQYADKDAEAFENFLLNDEGGKIPRENIETFINEKAVRTNVGDAISDKVRKAKPGDRIYFFFAGHGDMEDLTQIENGLLLLYNSPNGNYFGMNDDVLEILDLKRYLSPLSQRGIEVYFIIDACHSGNLKGGVQGIEQTASALASSWGKEFKILSCQPNQLSLESKEWGGGRGLFCLELEEGLKGLADKNNDNKITLLELQQYITENVSAISEGAQIPLIVGDLTKRVATVNPSILAALKKEKSRNYPILAMANSKGNPDEFLDKLDTPNIKLFRTFEKNIEEKKLIGPKEANAMSNYRLFERKNPNNPLIKFMRRDLASALNEKFNSIVSPLLKGERSYSSRVECKSVSVELDSCLNLLGEQHYMYNNIKARKLYMVAMSLTWALTESEYNIGLKPVLEKAIGLLEQSEKLEPNASYTLSALGTSYFYVYEYVRAFEKFQKYLDLRPKDFYARYSLAKLFIKLKEFEKAEQLLQELINEHPQDSWLYQPLCQAYFDDNKKNESLALARKLAEVTNDKLYGYFQIAVYYSKIKNIDSAKYYYELCKKYGSDPMCDNNIGHVYLMNNNLDSATYYFMKINKTDTTFSYPIFNLGTIDLIKENYHSAIEKFIKTIYYSGSFQEVYISNFNIYFNKHYNIIDTSQYIEFKNKVFEFDIQYASFLSILYCYLRDPALFRLNDKIELIFSKMKNYKEYDVYTYYHYACYMALYKNKDAAIDNIKKALNLGFGNYFMLTSDADLEYIQNTPEFISLLKQYFPDKVK
jgi:uncharacterized caspase-like protein/Flp pilus assembly protein TadD